MKKLVAGILFLGLAILGPRPCFAAYPPVQDVGPVSIVTMTAITCQMIPKILLSTGTNNPRGAGYPTASLATAAIVAGEYMVGRISLDVVNYSSHNIFIGYDKNVATWTAPAPGYIGWLIPAVSSITAGGYALQIPLPSSLHLPGSVRDLWVIADDTIPVRQILAVQQK